MPRLEGPRQEGPSALGLRWSRGREEVCRRAGLGPRQPRASLRAISGTTAPQSWPHAQALMQSEAWTQPVNLMLRSVFIM